MNWLGYNELREKMLETKRPTIIKPMLATLIKQPFTDDDYVFEIKWDGYRIIAFCNNDNVKLQSRGGEDYTRKYPSIVQALKSLKSDCILDGEVVYINSEGKPDFDALQKVNGQKAPLVYYAFDVLWLQGKNLMRQPLTERKSILNDLIEKSGTIKFSNHFEDGLTLFHHVQTIGLEGMVAKQKHSPYIPNDRSKKWLKITTENRQEFVIGGWVESEKRNTFRSLLFGAYENGKLKWKGHAGGGFKEREMPKILNRLKAIEINQNPFDSDVEYSEGKPHWVKPELVANIKFATTTKSGKIRKPAIFLGFRDDKKPEQVHPEVAQEPPTEGNPEHNHNQKSSKGSHNTTKRGVPASGDSNWPELERGNQEVFEIDSCHIRLYNVDRELWKGVTKAELIQYYNSISKYILPHLENRPLALHVKPRGPHAAGLYIKDMEQRQPDCAQIFSTPRKHKKAGKRDVIDYLVCNNTATLLYIVNLGCIDINPWTSTTKNSLQPDYIVIDLDPSAEDFQKVIEVAKASKEFFDKHKLKAFAKTSGKSGMHLFLPCLNFSFPQARTIAENICIGIHELIPEITTTEIAVADRGTKLYIDPNQNDYTDTVASVYSVRPFKRPYISTPIEWKELKADLRPATFTIQTIHKRLEKKGDLFLPTLDSNIAARNDRLLKTFL
jgi:bifunctional non-homologous end joining protein LigD